MALNDDLHQSVDKRLQCICLWIHRTGLLSGWPQEVSRTVNCSFSVSYFRLLVKWSNLTNDFKNIDWLID